MRRKVAEATVGGSGETFAVDDDALTFRMGDRVRVTAVEGVPASHDGLPAVGTVRDIHKPTNLPGCEFSVRIRFDDDAAPWVYGPDTEVYGVEHDAEDADALDWYGGHVEHAVPVASSKND